jgi:hypothetical protein
VYCSPDGVVIVSFTSGLTLSAANEVVARRQMMVEIISLFIKFPFLKR